jgi:hypothetical protein
MSCKGEIRVLAESRPGVRGVIDHPVWIDAMSGIPVDPPMDPPRQ